MARKTIDNLAWHNDQLVRDIGSEVDDRSNDEIAESVMEVYRNYDRNIGRSKASKYLTKKQAVDAATLASQIVYWANYGVAYNDYSNPPWQRKNNPRACALPGTMSTKTRDRLPPKAFGLPKERKYPMYTMSGGKLIPSGSHAANAKARAKAEFNDGRLSKKKLLQIQRKADKVLRECGTKGKPRAANPGSTGGTPSELVRRLKF